MMMTMNKKIYQNQIIVMMMMMMTMTMKILLNKGIRNFDLTINLIKYDFF